MRDNRVAPPQEGTTGSSLEAERDYYRLVAERLGRKALTDAQDSSRLIRHLREREDELRRAQDVLERTVAERTAELVLTNTDLQASTARFDQLVRRIPHGVYVMRFRPDLSFNFEYLSPRACEILGIEADALLRAPQQAFLMAHPDDREGLNSLSREMTERREPFRWEGRFLLGEQVRWIRLESDPTATSEGDVVWNGTISDVTERHETEAKLRESEELYRLLNQLAPNAVSVTDLNGVVTNVNPRALQLFGVERESDAVGMNIFDFAAPVSLPAARAVLEELPRAGVVRDLEFTMRRLDGTEFPGEVSASLLYDGKGHPRLLILVADDLTARRRAEVERLRLQKLEAIGTLAGGLAHDFNNLLQAVFGYVALAKAELANPRRASELLEQAERAMAQAINLTSQLLTFSKGGAPKKMPIALGRTVDNAVRFALSGSASMCELQIAPDLATVEADEGQIVQVLQNIILNASQAMDLAGTVTVSAENVTLRAGELSSLPAGGRFVRLRVRDHGTGIRAEHLPRLFDPYFTTKREGSGLGLATAHSVVTRHGGAIAVSSAAGTGSTFDIHLPASSAAPLDSAASTGPVTAPPTRRARVLVMDDEEMVRDVAGLMLRQFGYDVMCASKGEEAIEAVRAGLRSGNPPDVVILDLTVRGGLGGEETIKILRQIAPGVKAVLSSGYSDRTVFSDFQAFGFDACLSKPYSMPALKKMLAELVSRDSAPVRES